MKISKLEEGIIDVVVKTRNGSGGTDYTVKGKYVSGRLYGQEAFSEDMHESYDERDSSFSPEKNAALGFTIEAKKRGYTAAYINGKIEVKKNDYN